mmetsp:Transcript_115309/g.172329  ORF Transcript_115309/g.172329 Transcript_115309/m.172329 type:complete len:236 (+) Transcript_115309:177-884(+)|eukprot:CAMPEP_0117009932 /NCGR_PEP_ID=MMETSP0472-20121206/8887_1 /TAXON_ID=693140 ORGANISM="Tiarina fusus, Strain LIS" /NCGR_SAMPLE_ID=MMETSP0472 /ASSEMBLY_ACC=CAM_ASM_000603 /LENGTH=235 /DNA_ID=CAMNT_0004712345 /DNA_START=176 /DNA_END=883 /DNA_ORIENTATION=+
MQGVSVAHGNEDGKRSTGNAIHLDIANIRAYFNALISQLKGRVTLDTIRPLHQFMGVSGHAFCFSPEAFTPPVKKLDKTTTEKFKSRLRLNFVFFLSNYALVAAGVALVTALMHPGMLISIGVLWILWSFHSFLISNEVIVFGRNLGSLISITHRSAFLTALSVIIVVFKCLKPAITAVAISGVLVLAHAIMRDPKHISESSNEIRSHHKDSDSEGGGSDSEVLVERPQVRKDLA